MTTPPLDFDVVKRHNAKVPYTEVQMLELMNCHDEPMYFMRNFLRIQHPTRGALSFSPYPYQNLMVNAFHTHRDTVVLAGRQVGKTAGAVGYLLWRANFVPDSIILITANTYNQALEIMDRVRYAYENIPDHIRDGVREYNKGSIAFSNGSRIIARATTPNAGRGLSISLLYCLAGETTVQIRHKLTGEIKTVSLETLYGLCES